MEKNGKAKNDGKNVKNGKAKDKWKITIKKLKKQRKTKK